MPEPYSLNGELLDAAEYQGIRLDIMEVKGKRGGITRYYRRVDLRMMDGMGFQSYWKRTMKEAATGKK